VWETFPDAAPPDDDDVSFDVDSFEEETFGEPRTSAPGSATEARSYPPSDAEGSPSTVSSKAAPIAMQTAADLAGEVRVDRPSVSPESFHQGMAVLHPEYGPGKIIALSGAGQRRVATVAFAMAGQKKFILAQSPLRPARN
jgi:DNA helicase-2/ATP-dependent DNA helicase PcrA